MSSERIRYTNTEPQRFDRSHPIAAPEIKPIIDKLAIQAEQAEKLVLKNPNMREERLTYLPLLQKTFNLLRDGIDYDHIWTAIPDKGENEILIVSFRKNPNHSLKRDLHFNYLKEDEEETILFKSFHRHKKYKRAGNRWQDFNTKSGALNLQLSRGRDMAVKTLVLPTTNDVPFNKFNLPGKNLSQDEFTELAKAISTNVASLKGDSK